MAVAPDSCHLCTCGRGYTSWRSRGPLAENSVVGGRAPALGYGDDSCRVNLRIRTRLERFMPQL